MNDLNRNTQGLEATTATLGAQPDGRAPSLMSAATLVGNDVQNKDNEDLGNIKDLMIDLRSGRVSYAVLSFGGFMGLGDKLFAVPWDALKLDTVNKRFVLDVNKDQLDKAPGFNKGQWPDMADATWARGIHAYYGTKPYGDPPRT